MSCCTLYRDGDARTATERMWAIAQYYNIFSKADRGDIFIVHDQKSSYRTPLIRAKVERKISMSLGKFICPQASSHSFLLFLSIGKSYIASLVALRLKITTKSHTMWYRISILYSELCILSCVSVKNQRL